MPNSLYTTNPLLQKPYTGLERTTPTLSNITGPGAQQMANGAQRSAMPPVVATTPTVVTPTPTTSPVVQTSAGAETADQTLARAQGLLEPTIGEQLSPTIPTVTPYGTYESVYGEAPDEEAIRRNTMKMFQAEIDAVNQSYDQLVAQKRLEGEGRLGSTRAMAGRGGLLGSDFAASQKGKVQDYNSGIIQGVEAERAAKIGNIMGTVRKSVTDEIAAKNLARETGAKNYLEYLKNSDARKSENTNAIAGALLQQGIDPAEMTPEELDTIAKTAGLTSDDLKIAYSTLKSTQDAETAKTSLETRKTESEIAKNERITLSEGQTLLGADGKVIYRAPKTTAPGSGNGIPTAVSGTIRDRLESLRGSDTYTNTGEYLNEYASFVEAGGSPESFLKTFDPDKYINPNDPTKGWLDSQMKKGDAIDPIDQLIAGALTEALAVPQ